MHATIFVLDTVDSVHILLAPFNKLGQIRLVKKYTRIVESNE